MPSRIEYAVLALAVVLFLVLLVFRLGPAPLMLLPWLVIAGIGSHLIALRIGDGEQD